MSLEAQYRIALRVSPSLGDSCSISNKLNGTIPLGLGGGGSQVQLERVNLAGNSFEGDPPEYIGMCKSTFGSFDMSALGVDAKWIWELL